MRRSTNEDKRREYGPPPFKERGETGGGNKFAPIPGSMVKHLKAFNVQCAYYAANAQGVTTLITDMVAMVRRDEKSTAFSIDRNKLIDLIALANIGRQHLLFMEKESREIVAEARSK
jgi:hypothetical protein